MIACKVSRGGPFRRARGSHTWAGQNGEAQPNKCDFSPAGKHRRGARGMLGNTIKHAGVRKVAAAAREGPSGVRQARSYRLLTSRDICFGNFVHLTGEQHKRRVIYETTQTQYL